MAKDKKVNLSHHDALGEAILSEVTSIIENSMGKKRKDAKWVVQNRVSAIRFILGAICVLATAAHFYRFKTLPYPANRPILIACVIVYFIADGALWAYEWLHRKHVVSARRGSERLKVTYAFPKTSTLLTLQFSHNKLPAEELVLDITELFSPEGELDAVDLAIRVRDVLGRLAPKKKTE
ncbi:Signal peptidase complex subunit 2 [Carpediemonas membranifera]|uniref:Signal peptidase complex subunit 2 n=1 Tax=Carpediemonas membranifera TaxID=201153 RepID=A0A8J6AY26_9EUKA|nr:Signal peptidase complex subunit 2 [Carpediemonas membranifera]|eukprot:KAG9396928.1 Signal peptidase complex subunit 2 [Carpediemonas membranifera]